MSNERKPLLNQLRDIVARYQNRKTVGRMRTEHAVFIPSQLMIDKAQETDNFIRVARAINNQEDFNCPVSAEKHETSNISGIEFVFYFNADTKFSEIIEEIDTRIV